ncbi:MAG: hypothetical protein Q9207_007350 [Kuettlingeria erythrocarpa]
MGQILGCKRESVFHPLYLIRASDSSPTHSLHRMYPLTTGAPIFSLASTPSYPKHAPLEPPGAAPTLVTLEEHYKANLMGELGEGLEPKKPLDRQDPTNNPIGQSLHVDEMLEPNRPVSNGQPAVTRKLKMSLPWGTKITKKGKDKSER